MMRRPHIYGSKTRAGGRQPSIIGQGGTKGPLNGAAAMDDSGHIRDGPMAPNSSRF